MTRTSLRRLLASLLLIGFALALVQGRGASGLGPEQACADAEACEDGKAGEAGPELLGPLPDFAPTGAEPARRLVYELAGRPETVDPEDDPRGRPPGRAPPAGSPRTL